MMATADPRQKGAVGMRTKQQASRHLSRFPRLTLIGALLGVLGLGFTGSPALAASQAPTLAVGGVPSIPAGSTAMGAAASTLPIHLDVVLEPRDSAALQALALSVSTPGSSDHGQYLTP